MARTSDAADRIASLVGLGPYRRTPHTLTVRWESGHLASVFSYNRCIVAQMAPDQYAVRPCDSTPTTNRHVRAAQELFLRLGYDLRPIGGGIMIFTRQEAP